MPVYEYHCDKCNNKFERKCTVEEHGEKRPRCPKCDSLKVTQQFSSFFAKTASKS
ncbi:MAG: zinc ribbon domain-containing protein [Candidatus Omnitrophica bacterium]|nr:zinc ribbon domain-containing protein [Candidatus Omnitrophota bacterium]MBU4478566.1 zinc ribbon domain-containing protein [Candidatus Omnitrophota bacterium]